MKERERWFVRGDRKKEEVNGVNHSRILYNSEGMCKPIARWELIYLLECNMKLVDVRACVRACMRSEMRY